LHRRLKGTLIVAAVAALVAVFLVIGRDRPSGAAGELRVAAAEAARLAGMSYVLSDSASDLVALRPCPAAPISSTNVCGPMDRLPNHTAVVMRCWTDGSAPDGYDSPRWFYVTEVTGPHRGWSGYVYSVLVHDQATVPECTPAILDAYPLPSAPPAKLTLAQGPAAPAGYWYAVTLHDFPPDVDVSVTCHDSVTPDGFKTFDVHTDPSGSASAQRGCYSGDGPDHWVRSEGYAASSNHVTWRAAPATTRPPSSRPHPTATLRRGPTAPAGFWYSVVLRGFTPGRDVPATCYDSVSPGGFKTFTVRIDSTGAGSAQRGCYSGDGPDHWVRAGGVESNHLTWTWTRPPTSPTPPPTSPTTPSATSPPAQPKPTVANFVVVIYGGGHVGVAYDVGWQSGRDPVTCHFFIDSREAFTAQCGTHSSKQFYGVPPGQHAFHATVSDRFGVYSDPTPVVVRQVT
jgi:hypothetical protein